MRNCGRGRALIGMENIYMYSFFCCAILFSFQMFNEIIEFKDELGPINPRSRSFHAIHHNDASQL